MKYKFINKMQERKGFSMVKKVLIILVVILLIIGAGVGGYYICKVSMENNNSENSLKW